MNTVSGSLRIAFLFVLIPLISPSLGQEAVVTETADAVQDTGRQDTGRIVYIPLNADGVDRTELFDSMSSEMHWIAGSVTAFSRSLGLKSAGNTTLPREQVDELIRDYPNVFSYANHPETNQMCLAIDNAELAEMLADRKSSFRKWLASSQGQTLAKIYKVDSTWEAAPPNPRRIVVVLAGLHGVETSAEKMAVALHQQTNLPACVFAYSNDAPISESAGLLVVYLQDFHLKYPRSKITLVTHSMGGLVSRAAIEMEGRSAERSTVTQRTGIEQLIQVFPPNHGSALAQYGPVLDGAEQAYRLVNRNRNRKSRVLLGSIVDGFNEATADLQPDSRFLKQLNQCERNPSVRYTIFAGSGGPLRLRLTSLLGSVWDRIASAVDEPAALDARIRDVLTCDELQNGKGDGVVSLESARLPGVDDFQIFPTNHLSWNDPESEACIEILEAIASRLAVAL